MGPIWSLCAIRPPILSRASMMVTSKPCSSSTSAHRRPETPAPMIHTVRFMIVVGQRQEQDWEHERSNRESATATKKCHGDFGQCPIAGRTTAAASLAMQQLELCWSALGIICLVLIAVHSSAGHHGRAKVAKSILSRLLILALIRRCLIFTSHEGRSAPSGHNPKFSNNQSFCNRWSVNVCSATVIHDKRYLVAATQ
jgi:hypothetical protein